jgi:chloramphenicol 3-O phosphotransferase
VTGTIVLLNGAPRSGKSSIARAVQERLDGVWMKFGVDAAMAMQPAAIAPGIGLRPGGERPDLEPVVQQLYRALFDSIAAYARSGVNVVSDVGIHDVYSRPLGVLDEAVRRLGGLPVLFVGVRAPIGTIMARRNADPKGGYYAAGDDVPEPVRLWQEAPHVHGVYDIEIDTSVVTPEQAADTIGTLIQSWPDVTAFERLR